MRTLFDSTKLLNREIRNRFVRSATWEELVDINGHLTGKLEKLYLDLARGGTGIIITGYSSIMKDDQATQKMTGIYDDSFIPEYRGLTEKIHNEGAAIVMQIVHGGSNSAYMVNERRVIAPSGVENIAMKTMPQEMSRAEIAAVVKAFAEAALRVKKSGFDGVQIHVAHGFLLNQFMTPYYNRRTDEYGGSVENRARIVLETYRAVREAVGKDYPVLAKVNCEDFMDGGMSFEDSRYLCSKLAEEGIDAIEVSGGCYSSREGEGPARGPLATIDKESYFADYADKIAADVKVPVMLVGGNRSLEKMEDILNTTAIEYFSMARPLLCEPLLVNRWKGGDRKKAKCTSCGQCFAVEGSRYCIMNGPL